MNKLSLVNHQDKNLWSFEEFLRSGKTITEKRLENQCVLASALYVCLWSTTAVDDSLTGLMQPKLDLALTK